MKHSVSGLLRRCFVLVTVGALAAPASAAPLIEDWIAVSNGGRDDAPARFGSNLGLSNLSAQRAMAVDGAGNTYVTGSRHNGSNLDYLTQKFDAAGNLVWSAVYNGPGNSIDEANALALDSAGNVVVTGLSYGSDTGPDYATLKYSGATGEPLWSGGAIVNGAARYEGPNDGSDVAYAVAVDSQDNVLVTGYSVGGLATAQDFATLKYSGATGEPMWSGGAIVNGAARFNGPGSGFDTARALAVDSQDNVLVAGSSTGINTSTDYATLKYDGQTGAPMWSGGAIVNGAARYNNAAANSGDVITAIALDGNGDVVVTGFSYDPATNTDYATLKYDGDTGAPMWSGGAIVDGAARYNGPFGAGADLPLALAIGGGGNVVVTGRSLGSGTGDDFATLKYNGVTGAPMWTGGANVNGAARYNNAFANSNDGAYAVALDDDGNVVVTGYSDGGAGKSNDYATLKYRGTNGLPLWSGASIVDGAARYNGPKGDGHDSAAGLALDGAGNVRVAGTSRGLLNDDYRIVNYTGTGTEVWVADEGLTEGFFYQFGTNAPPFNRRALAVDAAGNSYVTGTRHNGSNFDYLTQKFDASGSLVWSATYNGPANDNDQAHALALDAAGDVVVTGRSVGSGTGGDYATLKYSGATGTPLWSGGAIVDGAARYNGPANGNDQAHALALDSAGDVVVTGRSNGSGTGSDYATLKYSGATGAPMWSGGAIVNGAARYNGPGNGNDLAYALALDAAGDVVVTGLSVGSGMNNDYATLKYSGASGTTSWSGGAIVDGAARYNGPANDNDFAQALALDAAGNVVVTGSSIGSGTGADYATLKYSGATGAPQWSGGAIVGGAARFNGAASGDDQAYALTLDAAGNVVVTGTSFGNGTNNDYATLKYSGTTGAALWSGGGVVNGAARYNGTGNGNDLAHALALDASGDVVVTGRSIGSGTSDDFTTLKYDGLDGTQTWVHRYEGGASGSDPAYAVAVAADASLRISGTVTTTLGERVAILSLRDFETSDTVLIEIAPTPSLVGAAVLFTAEVTGEITAPSDGQVAFTTDHGETCTDNDGPGTVDADTAAYSCSITFASAGLRTVTAAFSGSVTHGGSASDGTATHLVLNDDASLGALVPSAGVLAPGFAPGTLAYTLDVAFATSSLTLTPTATDSNATITVDGSTTASGAASAPIALNLGINIIDVVVTAQDGVATQTYTVVVTRADEADITLDKSSLTTEARPGDVVTYTLVVTNATGPSNANAVDILDPLPTRLDPASATWQCTGDGGASCSVANGTGDVDVTVSIPVGASVTVTVTATIPMDAAAGLLVNEATADLVSGADPSPDNNSDDHATVVPCNLFCDGFEDAVLPGWPSATAPDVMPRSEAGRKRT